VADNWLIWRAAQLVAGVLIVAVTLLARHLSHSTDESEVPYLVGLAVGAIPILGAVSSW